MTIRTSVARGLVLLALAIPLTWAEEQGPTPATRKVGAVTVAVDPSTGRLVPPTAEERRQLAEELMRMFAPRPDEPVVERRADGTRIVLLDGRNPTVTVLSLQPSGVPRLQCVTDDAAAAAWLEQISLPASSPAAAEER